jgi:hypothetical protein
VTIIDDEPFSLLDAARRRLIQRLLQGSTMPVTAHVDPDTRAITELRGAFPLERQGELVADVQRFLGAWARPLSLPPRLAGLGAPETVDLGDGAARVLLRQLRGQIPVYRAGVEVELGQDANVRIISTRLANPGAVPPAPRRTAADAADRARELIAAEQPYDTQRLSTTELVVVDPQFLFGDDREPWLAWRLVVPGEDGLVDVLVDDATGQVEFSSGPTGVVAAGPIGTGGGPIGTGGGPIGTGGGTGGPAGPTLVPTPQYHLNEATGTPDFITFGEPFGLVLPEGISADPATVALALFERYPLLFGTGDVPNQLQVREILTDTGPNPMRHVVLQQTYAGVPVFGAELRVHLSSTLAVRSVSGVYVRDPVVLMNRDVDLQLARETAVQSIASVRGGGDWTRPVGRLNRDDWETLNQLRAEVVDGGLVVLPLVLSDLENARNHLAWRFRFLETDLFVDAQSGEVVFALPTAPTVRRLFDSFGAAPFPPPSRTLILQDGVNVAPTPAGNTEIIPGDAMLATAIGFWATLGRPSWNGGSADSHLVTNIAFSPRNAMWVPLLNEMWFSGGQVVGDIVAHEYTHGVTLTSSGLFYVDESGALNEHYSDVMGNLCAPDATPGAWMVGENALGGVYRDMENPAISHYSLYARRGPGCTSVLDPLTNPLCDMGGVHTNSGIGNRAAVLLCDGDGMPAHPGIGRSRLGRLFADTLTKRLFPWARYIDELHNTWEAARDLSSRGIVPAPLATDPTPPPFDTRILNEVAWAFQQVGVDRRLTAGWFKVGGGLSGGRGFQTFYAGETMPAGFVVGDVELVVRGVAPLGLISPNLPPERYWEGRALASTGGSVAFDGGVFGAAITAHGIGTASKTTTVRWFHSGFLPLEITVNIIAAPAGGSGPVTLPTVIEAVSPVQVHWGTFGARGDDTVNSGVSVQGTGCVIDEIILELLDRSSNVQSSHRMGGPDAVYGDTGAHITAQSLGTADMTVGVHWWFDLGWACRYQLRYLISGTGCSA